MSALVLPCLPDCEIVAVSVQGRSLAASSRQSISLTRWPPGDRRRDAGRPRPDQTSDLQCPFCARFAVDTLPEIDKAYIATGKLLMAFRHLPLEAIQPLAVGAGATAECAGQQGRFWDMHDRLFQNPRQLDPSTLRGHAQALSLDLGAYDACLSGGAVEKVRADGASAAAVGVSGTPGFLLGTVESDGRVKVTQRMSGASPFAVFQAAIDGLLAAAGN